MTGLLRKLRDRVRGSSKSGTTFVSFELPLTQLCQAIPLKTIVEFGPGRSTRVFLEHTTASILSFETDLTWYNRYKKLYDSERVQVIYKAPGWGLAEIYECGRDFSMVFVDAGDRVAELKFAYHIIAENGIVFLHDAHREEYEEGIRCYPFVYFPERHSAILSKARQMHERIKAAVPSDYSCDCRYCSSETRRRYLSQFLEDPSCQADG